MKLTPDAELAIETIRAAGGRPLIVGGSVRDWLLGIPSKDIDIEVHGPVTPEAVIEALKPVGRVDLVGISFGVIKFGHGTDVSFPRSDSRTGEGHTGFEIRMDQSMTVEQALSRRDFTINSMAYDPATGEIIDPFDGRSDLRRRVLRHTSEAFVEDPLRVLRGVQFAGRFDFVIDVGTAALCRTLVDRFKELSIERVWMEWWKILTKAKSYKATELALKVTGLREYFPEWLPVTFADEAAGWCKEAGFNDESRAISMLVLSSLADEFTARRLLKSIGAPQWVEKAVLKIVTTSRFEPQTGAAMVRLKARELGSDVMLSEWLIGLGFSPQSTMWEFAKREGVLEGPLPRLVTGHHLIERGFEPGPLFRVILDHVTRAQDIQGWTDEKEALKYLDAQFKQ